MAENSAVSRRKFLRGTVVASGAAAATIASPHIARAAPVTLRMQGSWEAGSIFSTMAKQYSDRVNKLSGGELKIDYLPAGAVVKASQVQEAVHKGSLDMAHTVTAYWYDKNKAASLFGSGPMYGCSAAQILAWIHYGGGKEFYRELVQDIMNLNIVGFFSMPMPSQPLGWFKKHVKTPKDIKGIKYRTVGLAGDMMKGMGLDINELTGSEILPALNKGVIEAFEFYNPTADSNLGAQKVSKHYHLGSFHQTGEFFEIIVNKDKFEKLSEQHKAIIEYAAEAANTANYGLAMDSYSRDLKSLVEKDKVNVYRTDRSIMQEQLVAWDKVLSELEIDPFFKKAASSMKTWCERVGFYDINNAADYKMAYNHFFPDKLKF